MHVTYIAHMGTDLMVVNAARVSFNKESAELDERDIKLLKYLARHQHWSPFSHPQLSFRIKAPIFVARQLMRHQVGLTVNEVSRRYVDDEPEFYFPDAFRGRPENKKQGSGPPLGWRGALDATQSYAFSMGDAKAAYSELLAAGVAPEMARMVLPQSAYTEWYWTGSLLAFSRVCGLRLTEDTQEETRIIAQQLEELIKPLFPNSWAALRGLADE